jgi:hypothetical protein
MTTEDARPAFASANRMHIDPQLLCTELGRLDWARQLRPEVVQEIVGERTTDESVRQLKEMLSKLDPKLFA